MIYNLECKNIETKNLELWNTLKNRVINEGDGTYYKNHYYLAFINNNPIAVYINNKNIIHVIMLEKSKTQGEYILDAFKGFKYFDTITGTPKEIIDLAQNKEDFLNKNFEELLLL